ncbi:MAG: hypothetical protein NUV80_04650 [Candidatus Berkelbacteria bacterium]|nr:hypothetical protein [Candidatus Berkelbacteria bacterium]
MGNYDSGRASDFGGINIEARRADSINGVRFDSNRDDPSSANDVILYRGSGSSLRFWDGSSATTLGSAGGLVNYSLNDAYDDGVGITVDGSAVLLSGSHATNDVLDVRGSVAVTGALISLAQSGSGVDIDGTSSTWQVTAAGAGTFASLIAESVTAAANLTLEATGAGTIGIGGTSSGAITLGAGGGSVTITNGLTISGTADSNKLTITAGDILVSNGKMALTNDDTDTALSITAASVTTGNAVSITTDGITTGSALYIAMTEAGITSGNGSYIECYDSTAGATQFIVNDNGATTITGSAAGTAALTLTAGDITVSDGNLAITSTSTTDVVSITDNSLLANNALIVKGSGTFTGTGASSFVAITPTGTNTGTALYVAMAGATTAAVAVDVTTSTTTGRALVLTNTGILTGAGSALAIVADAATTPGNSAGEGVVNISADGLTTGTALNVESLSNELMTSGNLADFAHSAVGTTIAAKTGALVRVTSSMTESGTSTQDFDMVSVVRTSIHDTAGTLTATGSLLYLENVATETAATLTDTVIGLELVMDAQGSGDGIRITHPNIAGKAISIISSGTTAAGVVKIVADSVNSGVGLLMNMDGLTTGEGISIAHATSIIADGGSLVRIASTGADTGGATNGALLDLSSSGQLTGTVVKEVFAGLTTGSGRTMTMASLTTSGIGMSITAAGTGMTSGSAFLVSSGTTAAVATNGIVSFQATGNYTSAAVGVGFVHVLADTTTAGTALSVSGLAMTTGIGLNISATQATMTTGRYLSCHDANTEVFGIGANGHIHSVVSADAPTIAVSQQNGITAAAITAGGSDTCGIITTTGTNNNGGASVLQVTFGKTYTTAPKAVLLYARNQSAAKGSSTAGATLYATAYVSAIAATTFDITIPADSAATATPSWNYFVIA